MKIVLDASMALSWFFRDERNAASIAALHHVRDNGAIVPPLWTAEIAHVLLRAERRRRLTPERISTILDYLRALPVQVAADGGAPEFPQLVYARRFVLSSYDATYLDLAVRSSYPLASRDDTLMDAARALNVGWSA